jgi:NADPH:quinone reductase-like Zn-dependent oxidoreductase
MKAITYTKYGSPDVLPKEDFTRNGLRYDIIFAANGYHPLSAYKRALSPKGVYLMAGGSAAQMFEPMFLGALLSESGGRKMTVVSAKRNQKDLFFLKELVESRKIFPVIDRRYPLNHTAEALRYLGAGHARGKVVITVRDSG